MEIVWSTFMGVLFIFAVLAGIFILIITAFLVKNWHTTPDQMDEVDRIHDLVRRANNGDRDAQIQCANEKSIDTRLTYKSGKCCPIYTVNSEIYKHLR